MDAGKTTARGVNLHLRFLIGNACHESIAAGGQNCGSTAYYGGFAIPGRMDRTLHRGHNVIRTGNVAAKYLIVADDRA
jgi:hypothetical protein